MRIFPRRYGERSVAANSDAVLFGFPLPPGGTLNRLWAKVHIRGQEETDVDQAYMYGCSVWIVPVPDMDDTSNFDTMWDKFVPKDEAESEGGFDLDFASDVQPEFAAGGEIDWHDVFEIDNLAPREVWHRTELLTVCNTPTGYTEQAAADDHYLPTDAFKIRVGKRHRVKEASLVLCGLSSPSWDNTRAATAMVVPTEKRWMQYKFLGMTLGQAMIDAIGLIEAGAESPYAEALAWISELLEPNTVEEEPGL